MSLIFNALQRFGKPENDATVKQNTRRSKRKTYTLHGILISPAVLLALGAFMVVAGLLAVRATQSFSGSAVLSEPTARPVLAPQEDVPSRAADAPPSMGEPALGPLSDPVAMPVGESESNHRVYDPAVEQHANGPAENARVQFFAPEPITGGAGGVDYPAAGPSTIHPATPLPAVPESASDDAHASKANPGAASGLVALVMRSALPEEATTQEQVEDAPPTQAGSGVFAVNGNHRRQAAQAARHLDISQLVNQIRGAIQSEKHAVVAGLLEQLEELQGPENLFVIKLRAYWRIRQGQMDQARILLQKVLSQQPDDRESGLNMAVIDMHSGRYAQARQRLEYLQNLYPEDSGITLSLRRLAR